MQADLFLARPEDLNLLPSDGVVNDFGIVLFSDAAAVILVHNHPSGDPEPSQADRTLTTTLKNTLNMIGTQTLDHIVVGSEGCVSMAERATCRLRLRHAVRRHWQFVPPRRQPL